METSIGERTFKGASWLALFKLISQAFSWVTTIIIARILVPGDYGLLTMATIVTGYAEIFSELGLGNAIIQKSEIREKDLSSVFWFSFLFSVILALSCFPIAYLTANIFDDPRVIPLTKAVGLVFIFSGMQIVPLSLLKKELNFKAVGKLEMMAAMISGMCMIVIAFLGGGVWTLVGGYLIRSFSKMLILYFQTRWLPKIHFNFSEAKSYIKFGITMSFGRSLFYIWERSDRYLAGRAWKANILGYYTFALEISQIPTEKIVTLINQVAFPALSKLQHDHKEFNKFYLNVQKITAFLVMPLFMGGFLVGEDIIKLLLNDQWYPMITVFKYLCLTQIFMSLNAINNFVHASQGRPHYGVYYHIAGIVLMPISFYFAVPYGLNGIIFPWMSSFVILTVSWIIITLRTIGIPISVYIRNMANPAIASMIMFLVVILFRSITSSVDLINSNILIKLGSSLTIAVMVYLGYIWMFERNIILLVKKFKKS